MCIVNLLLNCSVCKKTQAQRGAAAAIKSGVQSADMKKLAAIGSQGRYPNHCNHELMHHFCPNANEAPPVDTVKAPVVDKEGKVIWVECAVMFPHRTFAHLSSGPKEVFDKVFGGDDQIKEWWGGQDLIDPKLYNHPLLRQPDYRSGF